MILSFPHRKSSHISIETKPFMLWMRGFDPLGLWKRRLEVNFEHILGVGFEEVCNVNPVRDEHIVAFENDFVV